MIDVLLSENTFIVFSETAGTILVGEWWKVDPEAVISQALQTGGGPNVSDAYTINGLPGPLYNCSSKGIIITCYHHTHRLLVSLQAS